MNFLLALLAWHYWLGIIGLALLACFISFPRSLIIDCVSGKS